MIYRRLFDAPTWNLRSPFEELERFKHQINKLFEDFPARRFQHRGLGVFPLVNLTEDNNNFYIRAELPGVNAEDLDIQTTGNGVSITGERRISSKVTEAKYHRRERESGKFSRVLALPSEIDAERVSAKMTDGILTIVVPKAEKAKPRQIQVR